MSMYDTFSRLPRKDREAAFQVARTKMGPGKMVHINEMLEAHMGLKEVD